MNSQLPNPTTVTYKALDAGYEFLNKRLFDGKLRHCLITMQRRRTACGFFASARFMSHDRSDVSDEIGLDPRYWGPPHTDTENLSTLVHEMCHLWQYHCGRAGRGGYHNREFSRKMFEIGLITSDTGAPGGRRTGTSMSHYVAVGGPFHRACLDLLNGGFVIPYVEILSKNDEERMSKRRLGKVASKTTYVCPNCDPPVHVWGKPHLHIVCGACDTSLVTQPGHGWDDRTPLSSEPSESLARSFIASRNGDPK